MAKIRKKNLLEINVYEKALERLNYLFDNFDKVVVSFSGGKDSTAVLNVALQVAKERGKLPLDVVFFDEEAIHPPTIDYVQRVSEMPEVNLQWYCLEFKHRNACSNEQPFWYTWAKEDEDKWVRPMPEQAITSHPAFKRGITFQDFSPKLYPKEAGKIAMLTGVRAEESLTRYRVVANKKNDNYIEAHSKQKSNQYLCHPVYDWSSKDVWLAVHKFGWDYNQTYDVFNQTRDHGKFLQQRVCPPYGEEPLRGLWIYAECFPEMWHKMLYRVKGVSTAWRYSNTELYSSALKKPEHLTYKQYLNVILDSYAQPHKNTVKKMVNKYLRKHNTQAIDPIKDADAHPVSGVSWRLMCNMAMRGSFKSRANTAVDVEAENACKKLGITHKEAKIRYGR